MSNTPKRHDNSRVSRFLEGYFSAADLCEDHAAADDIISGALALKTAGDTATRSLSRQALFYILQRCQTIDVASLDAATNGAYAYSTLAAYAALSRVVSKAFDTFIDTLPETERVLTVAAQRLALDAPHDQRLRALRMV